MKKMFNVFAVLCVALMFFACAGNNAKIVQTAPCISIAEPVVIPDAPVIKIIEPVMFDWDSDVIRDDQNPTIDRVADIMKEHTDIVLVLEGFASVEGPEDYNLDLSKRRAESVKSALVDLGVSADRITTNGLGETEQFGSELPPNRRVMVLSVN
jgi:outer membrane protein OmpA-like peptidoglycan-associated protein